MGSLFKELNGRGRGSMDLLEEVVESTSSYCFFSFLIEKRGGEINNSWVRWKGEISMFGFFIVIIFNSSLFFLSIFAVQNNIYLYQEIV